MIPASSNRSFLTYGSGNDTVVAHRRTAFLEGNASEVRSQVEIEAIDVAEHVPCLTKIPYLSYSSKDTEDELEYTIEYLHTKLLE